MTSKQKRRATLGETTKPKKGARHQTLGHVGVVVQFFLHFDKIHRFFLDFETLAVSFSA